MAQGYQFKTMKAFNQSLDVYNQMNIAIADVSKGAQASLAMATNTRQASADRMTELNKLLAWKDNFGDLTEAKLTNLGISTDDLVLKNLLLPEGKTPNLADEAAVRSYYSSVVQQLSAINSGSDQAQSSDTQMWMGTSSSCASSTSSAGSLLQSISAFWSQVSTKIG